MIGCTLKWSLLNFKQDNTVLAAKAVPAQCGGSALRGGERVCVSVCSSTKPDATVSGP